MAEKRERMQGKNLADLKKDLFEVLEVETQKELAVKLGMSEATISRFFTDTKEEYKRGPQSENIEKIVSALMKKQEYAENEKTTYILVCNLLCPNPEEYINEYELKQKKYDVKNKKREMDTEIIKDDALINSTDLNQSTNESKLQALNISSSNMKSLVDEKTKEIIEEIGYEIINEKRVSDNKVLFRVKWEGKISYRDKRIEWIYGIELTENNYTDTIHEILGLEERDGIIILYCEQFTLDRASRDEILKVQNNVLLCNTSKESKLYVKSVRKGEKGLLRFHFGPEKLIFPGK